MAGGISQITLTGSAYSGFVHYFFHFASGGAMEVSKEGILARTEAAGKICMNCVGATESRRNSAEKEPIKK